MVRAISPVFSPVSTSDGPNVASEPPEPPSTRLLALRALRLGAWITVWFAVSISMTIYNKWLFALHGLRFPLLITSMHFFLKSILARTAMYLASLPALPVFCSTPTSRAVALTGLATAADVALSNQSFLYVSVTTYTIVKSSVPVWILAFSIPLGLRKPNLTLLLVLVAIVGGICLTTAEPSFDLAQLLTWWRHAEPARAMRNMSHGSSNNNRHGGRHHAVWQNMLDEASVMTWLVRRKLQASTSSSGSSGGIAVGGGNSSLELEVDAEDGGGGAAGEEWIGFACVLAASLCAGFRWACSQLLLTGKGSGAASSGGGDNGSGADDVNGLPRAREITEVELRALHGDEDGVAHHSNGLSTAAEASMGEHDGGGGVGSRMMPEVKLHPYVIVFGTSLSGNLLLIPSALTLEITDARDYAHERGESELFYALCLSSVGGFLAFLLLVAELRVVALSSGLSLSVAGTFKEVLTVVASVIILNEQLSSAKVLGLACVTAGLILYTRLQILEDRAAKGP